MAAASLIVAWLWVAAPPPPTLSPEEFAQAQTWARDGEWAKAAQALSPRLDPATAPAPALALLTRAVLESGDVRRARLLAERGLFRFPDDLQFRRLDLAVLIARRQWPEAVAAAKSVLAQRPDDAIAWRQLAAATLESADEAEQRAVLEAAMLAIPDDPVLYDKHVRAQFLAEHYPTAARWVEKALERPDLVSNPSFIRLAVRVAEAAQRPRLARRWLEKVPPAERDRALTLLEARLALAENAPRRAERALDRLIARGDASSSVLVRAGQLAEARGAWGRAEALYRQAAEGRTADAEATAGLEPDDSARVARLFLARFLVKIEQTERAERTLRAYLAEYPDDAYARQLLRLLRK